MFSTEIISKKPKKGYFYVIKTSIFSLDLQDFSALVQTL